MASADKVTTDPWRWIAGANVSVYNTAAPTVRYSTTTDSNGVAQFTNLPTGKYSYTVTANGYIDVSSTTALEPGKIQSESIYMPTQLVSYSWTVDATTIQDQYNMKLNMTYRTDVFAPVVIIEPKYLTLKMSDGESQQMIITVENKGLIDATDISVLQGVSDSVISMVIPNGGKVAKLGPGEKVSIPVTVTLAHATCHEGEVRVTYKYCSACGIIVNAWNYLKWRLGDDCGMLTGQYDGLVVVPGGGISSGSSGTGVTGSGTNGTSGSGGGSCGVDQNSYLPNPYIGERCDSVPVSAISSNCLQCVSGIIEAIPDGYWCEESRPGNACKRGICKSGLCVPSDKTLQERHAINESFLAKIAKLECPDDDNLKKCELDSYSAKEALIKEYRDSCSALVQGPPIKPNGCTYPVRLLEWTGALKLTTNVNPNQPLGGGPYFTDLCDTHDQCYGQIAPMFPHTKFSCGLTLFNGMQALCDSYYWDRDEIAFSKEQYNKCMIITWGFLTGLNVQLFSYHLYDWDQLRGTRCCAE